VGGDGHHRGGAARLFPEKEMALSLLYTMKNAALLFIATCLLFSCNEETKPVINKDSLAEDSAFKARPGMIPKTERSPDTLHMVALPPVFEGDLVFQNLGDEQLMAFGEATKSKYNNVGMIFMHPRTKVYMVVDAHDSVHTTPLTEWVSAGTDQKVALLRLKNSNLLLGAKKTKALLDVAKPMKGTPYDPYYSWSDEAFYPSEFIWKVYNQGPKLDLCETGKLSDLDLSGSLTAARMKTKYGDKIPKDEKVVTPDQIYKSPKLEIVFEK
jgi:hypothetical protein